MPVVGSSNGQGSYMFTSTCMQGTYALLPEIIYLILCCYGFGIVVRGCHAWRQEFKVSICCQRLVNFRNFLLHGFLGHLHACM